MSIIKIKKINFFVELVDFYGFCRYNKAGNMAKNTIWQKIDHKINQLKILQNKATLVSKTIKTDVMTGKTAVVSESCDFKCSAPEQVEAAIIDNTLVYAGDCRIVVDYLTMREMFDSISSSIEWNENTGFIQCGIDEIIFSGVTYAVRHVIPQDWQNNQPGEYVVILKGVTRNI